MKVQRSLVRFFERGGWELVRITMVNGLPGFITREADGELQTTALDIEDGKVTAIYVMRNPDKLKHLH
ncbi:RNA polymerase sigma factor SigJ [Mycobacterium tuberculosis]|nr:RNA polymerase sigma factor SigJ [Mycobacterium tuberculosis]